MDNADRAQIAEERAYKRLFDARSAESLQRAADDEGKPYHCLDCGELIPQARVNLGFTLRCAECQSDFEQRMKQQGRR